MMTDPRTKTVLLLCVCYCISVAAGLPTLDISGFEWAENLVFDGQYLFVSDALNGTLHKIHYDSTVNEYVSELHIDGFKGMLGLACQFKGQPIASRCFVAAHLDESSAVLLEFSRNTSHSYKTVAKLDILANGLALHEASGMLYTCAEGHFLPENGHCMSVDPDTGESHVIIKDYTSLDGAYIDQERHILYASNVLLSKLIVYNLTDSTIVSYQSIPCANWFDDFTLSPDGTMMYGASFEGGAVVRFTVPHVSECEKIHTGLDHPTSARFGYGPNFRNTSLYVTEGGPLIIHNFKQRVIELPNVLQ